MKKRTVLLSIVFVVLLTTFVFSTPGISQSPPPPTGLEKLEQDTDGKVEITWNSLTDTPSFVRGSIPLPDGNVQSESDTSAAALSFVERYADLFGVSDASQELNVVRSDVDALGMRHVTLQQVYQGVEVYGAHVKVHLSADGQEVMAASNSFVPGIALDNTRPRVHSEEAVAIARQALPNGTLVTNPKLVVYPGSSAHLVWLVQLRDDTIPARNVYVVDAINENVLDVLDRLYKPIGIQVQDTMVAGYESQVTSATIEQLSAPKFLTLPFSPDPEMRIQQGWTSSWNPNHHGIDYIKGSLDISSSWQSFPVLAAADGEACGQLDGSNGDCVTGPGNRVLVKHTVDGQTFYTYYGHLSTIDEQIPLGSRNNTIYVRRGQIIGYAGDTGATSGWVHLHFGLTPPTFEWVDPYDLQSTRENYPDPNGTNGRTSGSDHYWTTNPPTYYSPCSLGQYYAEYYNNRTLDGDPVFTRCEDPPIAYNWGHGAPGDGVDGNNFSVRWTGWFSFTEDTYNFAAQTDDGMKVWVDDTLIIDAWRDQRPTSYEASLELDEGPHQVKVEYYENAGGAVAHLRWWGDGSDTDDGRLIASGEMLFGNIQPVDDVDTYYFNAIEGQQATIRMKKNFFTPSLDPYLVLYDPEGREVARDDNSGEDTNALINRVPLTQTGKYRIEAQSYEGNSIGLYHLNLRLYHPGQSSRETYDADYGYNLPGTLARSEGDDPTGDQDVDDAHDFAGATYDYYWNTHGRDSYDDEGVTLVSTANYGRSYMNAYWNGEQTVYGDHFPVKDVVAHEWTHAVTEHSAALEYRWQSGALNESFSDIFGAMVDRDNWLMGEDLPPHVLGGREAIRDLSDPPRFGQPDHTDDWVKTCSDNEGVHTNNGILNKAYYNIATAIGKDKAEHIFYRVLTVYLDVNSSMEDARTAALQSTWDLSHTLGYAATYTTVYTTVHDGFDAVGLDGVWQPDPNDCSCAASTALSDETVYSDKLTALEAATTLYRARDQLLIGKAGEHYRMLYEQHTGRINRLLLKDAALRAAGGEILKQVTPGLSNLMNGVGKEDVVTQKTVDEILSFLHQLAKEDRSDGDGDLADTIEREMDRIEWDRLVGMTYEEAWTYIQSRITLHSLYLPLVMK